jgi:hypothetical protein
MGNMGITEMLLLPVAVVLAMLPAVAFFMAYMGLRRIKVLEAQVAELMKKQSERTGNA